MSNDALKLAEALAASTPGVWCLSDRDGPYVRVVDGIRWLGDAMTVEDARLFVEAHNRLPSVLAEIENLRAAYADTLADADASQHWRTRAVRAETALEETRAALRLATEPKPDDRLGWRLINANLPDYVEPWVGQLLADAWRALLTLRADGVTRAATIAAQAVEIERLEATLEETRARSIAWNDGASAQCGGLDRDACPYPPDSVKGGAWLGGWTADAWQPGGRMHGALMAERDDLSDQIAAIRDWIDARTDAPRTSDDGQPLTLVQRLNATRAEFVRVREERDELQRTVWAEHGDPRGAPDPAWTWVGDGWGREYPNGECAEVYRGRWYRALSGRPPRAAGQAKTMRAGMIDCDKADQ